MVSRIYGAYFALALSVLWLTSCVLKLVTAPFDKDLRLLHKWTGFVAFKVILMERLWGCRFTHTERLDPRASYIFIANHQSLADILVLFGLNRNFRWVAKDFVFRTPILGAVLSLNEYVRMPKTVGGIRTAMKTCRQLLARGISLFIFPEGTRSGTGEIQKFYAGAFKLSVETGVPIVPIVIDGTRSVLPKGSLLFRFGGEVQVRVLPPVHPALCDYDVHNLETYVRSKMQHELQRMRGIQPIGSTIYAGGPTTRIAS
jgi:1-acyl-sn-glycerol-3-phosphate acyltransferase